MGRMDGGRGIVRVEVENVEKKGYLCAIVYRIASWFYTLLWVL